MGSVGVNIGGNYHNPLTTTSSKSAVCQEEEWSAYVIASAVGATVTGNACSRRCAGKNVSLLSVGGVDSKHWDASKVRVESNGGWREGKALRLRMGNSSTTTGGSVPAMAFETFAADWVPGRNLIESLEPGRWRPMTGRPNVSVASGLLYNGEPVVRWQGAGSTQVAALPLELSPAIAGQAVFATVRAQVGTGARLRLTLDAGDGSLVRTTYPPRTTGVVNRPSHLVPGCAAGVRQQHRHC